MTQLLIFVNLILGERFHNRSPQKITWRSFLRLQRMHKTFGYSHSLIPQVYSRWYFGILYILSLVIENTSAIVVCDTVFIIIKTPCFYNSSVLKVV